MGPAVRGVRDTAIGLFAKGVGTRRTEAGRQLWSRAGGFERLLATPSSEDRFDFAASKDLFISYIPYAVAFGVADRWAGKYRIATGQEPPVPMWYTGAAGLYSPDGFTGLNSAVAASISAYMAYQAAQASSSGSGGSSWSSSGGSWGGGGGSGGGSW